MLNQISWCVQWFFIFGFIQRPLLKKKKKKCFSFFPLFPSFFPLPGAWLPRLRAAETPGAANSGRPGLLGGSLGTTVGVLGLFFKKSCWLVKMNPPILFFFLKFSLSPISVWVFWDRLGGPGGFAVPGAPRHQHHRSFELLGALDRASWGGFGQNEACAPRCWLQIAGKELRCFFVFFGGDGIKRGGRKPLGVEACWRGFDFRVIF